MRQHCPSVNVPPRFFGVFALLIFALPLALMSDVSGAEDESAHLQARKKTSPYYQDAQICRSKSKVDPLPDGTDPATTIDPQKFLVCINQMGYHQDAKTDPLLVAIQRCYGQKTKSASISGEVVYRAPSQAQMRACLSDRGFPSAGTPPNPNAAVVLHQSTMPKDSESAQKQPARQPSTGAPQPPQQSPDENTIETVIIPPRQR